MASEFGKRLAQAREHAGLTQVELAAKVPMAQSTLASAEAGGDGSRMTVQIARVCGVNPYWLATGEGGMLDDIFRGAATGGAGTMVAAASALQPDLAEQLVDLVAAMPAARWRSVRAQLDILPGAPEMRDDVVGELRALLATPSKRQDAV